MCTKRNNVTVMGTFPARLIEQRECYPQIRMRSSVLPSVWRTDHGNYGVGTMVGPCAACDPSCYPNSGFQLDLSINGRMCGKAGYLYF